MASTSTKKDVLLRPGQELTVRCVWDLSTGASRLIVADSLNHTAVLTDVVETGEARYTAYSEADSQ